MVVRSGVMSPLIQVITLVTRLITLLITTHEPPRKFQDQGSIRFLHYTGLTSQAMPAEAGHPTS